MLEAGNSAPLPRSKGQGRGKCQVLDPGCKESWGESQGCELGPAAERRSQTPAASQRAAGGANGLPACALLPPLVPARAGPEAEVTGAAGMVHTGREGRWADLEEQTEAVHGPLRQALPRAQGPKLDQTWSLSSRSAL